MSCRTMVKTRKYQKIKHINHTAKLDNIAIICHDLNSLACIKEKKKLFEIKHKAPNELHC